MNKVKLITSYKSTKINDTVVYEGYVQAYLDNTPLWKQETNIQRLTANDAKIDAGSLLKQIEETNHE